MYNEINIKLSEDDIILIIHQAIEGSEDIVNDFELKGIPEHNYDKFCKDVVNKFKQMT